MIKEYIYKTIEIPENVMSAYAFQLEEKEIQEYICNAISTVLNSMAQEGWEPLTPFGLPTIWFVREKRLEKEA